MKQVHNMISSLPSVLFLGWWVKSNKHVPFLLLKYKQILNFAFSLRITHIFVIANYRSELHRSGQLD